MFYRIANLVHKELLQVSRDWLLIIVLIIAPVVQLYLLAYSTGKGIKNLPVAVWDMDQSRASRDLLTAIDNTEELRVSAYARSLAELYQGLDAGRWDVAVIVPANLGQDLAGGVRTPQVQVMASGANNLGGQVGLAATEAAINRYVAARNAPTGQAAGPIDFRADIRYNPTLNSRNYSIPAMIGMIVFELTLSIASQGLTRERETGTLEQLIVMPFRRIELIIGKAIPPLLITLADFALMLVVAVYVFGVPMRGAWGLLFGLTALFMLAETMWGLLISTFARTQQQAILFVFVEAMLDLTFSGFMVSVNNLPTALQWISSIVPLRYYLTIIRGIMLKGAGFEVLWPQAAALAALAVAIGVLAMVNVGRRLD